MTSVEVYHSQPSVAYLGFGKGRAYNGGLGAEPPAGSRGRAPGEGVREASPPEAETLCFWTFNGSRKFAHFSEIRKRRKSQRHIRCNLTWRF